MKSFLLVNKNWLLLAGFLLPLALRTVGLSNYLLISLGLLLVISFLWLRLRFVLVTLFVVFFGLGLWRSDSAMRILEVNQWADWFGNQVEVVGIVSEPVDNRFNSTKFILKLSKVCLTTGECRPVDQSILVTAGLGAEVRYGDLVWVRGELKEPLNFTNQRGRTFDYVNYLAKANIKGLMSGADWEVLDSGYGNKVRAVLLDLKTTLIVSLNKSMESPASSLGAGIVFGEKQGLGKDWEDRFRKTGLTHLVVLSGYNISIVADVLLRVGLLLGPLFGWVISLVGIIAFALLVGGGATVVRASLMAILLLVGRRIGRRVSVWWLLFLSGGIMLLFNPLLLLYDISFQLSFLATIGLIGFYPWILSRLSFVPSFGYVRENLATTLSAQLAVLPVLVLRMGEVSIIAPIANVLVLPAIPIAMLFTFLTSLLGLFWGDGAVALAGLGSLFLNYVLFIVEKLSSFSWSILGF